MKLLLALVFVLAACSKKKDEPAPAPSPKPETKSETKPAGNPSGACEVMLKLTPDKVEVTGAATASIPRTAGTAPDLASLAAHKACTANITADPATSYQDVIDVMDMLTKHGVADISLGEAKPRTKKPTAPRPSSSDFKFEVKPDGTIVGEMPKDVPLENAPVIVLSKTEATINGKVVGPIGEISATAVSAALPKVGDDPTVIVQADQSLTYGTIAKAVEGAASAGYDNVLFAVKNR